MGADGCIWVCMGVVGHKDTNAQENRPARDTNGLTGYDSRPCMAGKFPQKRHICVGRHKGVRRDSGGWGMGLHGFGGMHIHAANAKQGKQRHKWLAGHRFGKGVGREIDVEWMTRSAHGCHRSYRGILGV